VHASRLPSSTRIMSLQGASALPVRFYLQIQSDATAAPAGKHAPVQPVEGQTHAMSCQPTMTFGEIKVNDNTTRE
jgi:hypothetical protein